jgi:hypothetical protein
MLDQLQDAGTTVTLAGYLRLLETAFPASGLELSLDDFFSHSPETWLTAR